ncbi:hypothetical protein Rhopal_000205-T1 [Rhodotorula paludigena]|uniref:Glycosyltransferase n=1 Tax=Rhodotorula paludigena TaxID=86838 RepID=A0AAV5GD59_9BASI|nr:hypothetical protein Rhopal_000205-T1 [Rhodotorula paludigena]
MLYHNTPVSPHRPPSHQFLLDPSADLSRPTVAIITATNNPRSVMRETATTVFGQSLQNLVWVIVDDHTDEPDSLALLKEFARDPRVVVVKNPGQKGLAAGRNVGLDYVFRNFNPPPKYLVSLDDDDLFEFTALEKTCWMLESNADWDLGGFRYIKWGASNETVVTGLHSGRDNYVWGNFVPNAAVYTSRAVLQSGCRYNEEEFHDGGEDWDFWMCLAEGGYWGGSVLEPLYRVNEPKFRAARWGNTFVNGFDALKRHIQGRHPSLKSGFPSKSPKRAVQLEAVSWDAPFEQALAHADKKIMFIVPWLYMGGADIGALHMIQLYALAGYRVTVVCTLNKVPEGLELRPYVLQFTHDVHVLPAFLRPNDFPRYLKHLVESRGIHQVVLSNSQLVYEMLPALVVQLPDVEWIDYLHNEAYDGWKAGGYPRYSVISQRYLARTITCSHYLKHWLLENGHLDANRIGVVKLGIEASQFVPATPAQRTAAKTGLLGVEADTFVITVVGRLDPQKRPLLIPLIVAELVQRTEDDFLIVMLGDGELRKQLERAIARENLGEFVHVLGTQQDPSRYYAASDLFLLPSVSEGISIAVAEAMAMGLPVVTARAGALPEQLGELDAHGRKQHGASELGGELVDHTLENDRDAALYADAIVELMQDPARRERLGSNARKLVEDGFDWRTTLAGMFGELDKAGNLPGHGFGDPKYPHPAAYYATAMLLDEMGKETDMSKQYPAQR